ncbi:hypothetical protein ACFFFP_06715 [Thermus composti]|uniref:Uncharacterized protein n=1 Tax=Thermus composti TaxID=532059 RepID=A0ABV6Q2P5_9DEIN|nr:hypothetical protein [Thermus composti]
MGHQVVKGQEGNLPGHKEKGHHGPEKEFPTGQANPGQGITSQGRGGYLAQSYKPSHQQAIKEEATQGKLFQGDPIVLQRRAPGNEVGVKNLLRWLKTCRKEGKQREKDKKAINPKGQVDEKETSFHA